MRNASSPIVTSRCWLRCFTIGSTASTAIDAARAAQDSLGGVFQVVARGVPLGREQTPEDIGELAAFLASDAGRNITGQWIAVDGGITLRPSR